MLSVHPLNSKVLASASSPRRELSSVLVGVLKIDQMTDINVLAELERIGWSSEWASDEEVRVKCPFHEDTTPSCSINIEKRVFSCQTAGCGASGDFIKFLCGALKTTRQVIYADLSTRYVLDTTKIISAEVIERYHRRIKEAKPLLRQLYHRGVTDALIAQYRLGEDNGRITIPIPNEGGLYVNVRRYLPGAPGKDKMRNTKGHSSPRLYPIGQLQFDKIVICGGELKAVVVADQLNKHGIGAISTTQGEGNWDMSFTPHFKNKTVYVCLDVDDAGQSSAADLCNMFSRVTDWVGNVILPLDKDKYPKGDPNDFIGQEKGEMLPVLDACEEWTPTFQTNGLSKEPPEELPLSVACTAESSGKRVKVQAVVSALADAPYVIPKEVRVTCTRSEECCATCPVYIGTDKQIVPDESQAILAMVGQETGKQREVLMQCLGIPMRCKVCSFYPEAMYNCEDVRLTPTLAITERNTDNAMQPAVVVGKNLELNETYNLVGRMHPHPKNQQSTLIISEFETAEDALSSYEPRDLHDLELFRPPDWTEDAVRKKLHEIYKDLEANVTRIFQRRSLHLVIDLVYHSPLLINFDGKNHKGWLEALVVGDSSQGKSETAINLMNHYGLGEKVECKNATVAGLLGGLTQLSNKWFVTWGTIPTQDKRLVILEELKGASTEVIAKLTDMRSSGIAEIPKIERRKTHARTRLIAISNPRSAFSMSSYNYGLEAIPELIGGLEDIRRFDICHVVNKVEVDAEKLNQLQTARPQVEHAYTGELCRRLILWAWTREPDQVIFEDSKMVLEESTRLCGLFTDAIPIVDRGSMRLKLARLAAAVACRTFSTTEDHTACLVRPCHVQFASKFLETIYSSAVFGYLDYTKAQALTDTIKDPEMIRKHVADTPFPKDFIEQLLHTPSIDAQDIKDWCGWDHVAATNLISLLVRKFAIRRDGRQYRKSPAFIEMLKEMQQTVKDRPDFITEEDEF